METKINLNQKQRSTLIQFQERISSVTFPNTANLKVAYKYKYYCIDNDDRSENNLEFKSRLHNIMIKCTLRHKLFPIELEDE